MKRPGLFLLVMICLACLLASCGRGEPLDTDWNEAQMARAVWDAQGGTEGARTILSGSEEFDSYVSGRYQIVPDSIEGGAIFYAGDVSAQEIAILRLADASEVEAARAALAAYITSRAGAFAGYAPEQFAIVENSGTAGRGPYAALLICPDQQAARDAFAACFTTEPPVEDPPAPPDAAASAPAEEKTPPPQPETPDGPETSSSQEPADLREIPQDASEDAPPPVPEPDPAPEPEPPPEPDPEPEPPPEPEPVPAPPQEPWHYDQTRIVNAWSAGTRDGLWEQDLAILEVLEGIPALTDETLPDYDRELALHDWMIAWAEYDPGALSSDPYGEPMPDNDNPYGFLTGKKGICLGYAATFQLLMELSGIECVTVRGLSHAGTADHAWNLVKLEGDWYAVDTTWDDPVASFPVSAAIAHQYFNVTDEFLRQHDHQWDESGVPAALGGALAWVP